MYNLARYNWNIFENCDKHHRPSKIYHWGRDEKTYLNNLMWGILTSKDLFSMPKVIKTGFILVWLQ